MKGKSSRRKWGGKVIENIKWRKEKKKVKAKVDDLSRRIKWQIEVKGENEGERRLKDKETSE